MPNNAEDLARVREVVDRIRMRPSPRPIQGRRDADVVRENPVKEIFLEDDIYVEDIHEEELMSKTVGKMVGISPDPSSIKESSILPSDTLMGIEVELENMSGIFDKRHILKYWDIKEDGSLRNNGAEFVFKQPFGGVDIVKACIELEKFIRDNGYSPDLSDRTSVHVHLDVRELSPEQLQRLMVIYTVFERLLFKFAGEERMHNIFSLPLEQAQGSMRDISKVYKCDKYFRAVVDKTHKYSAFNLKALNRYGSLEFRHHKGEWKSGRLLKWASIIQCLKIAAIEDISIDTLHQLISNKGPIDYLHQVFGKYSKYLEHEDVVMDIMEGVRLSQDIVHLDTLFDSVETKSMVKGDMLSQYCSHHGIEAMKTFTPSQIAKIYQISVASAEGAIRRGLVNNASAESMLAHRLHEDPTFELGA